MKKKKQKAVVPLRDQVNTHDYATQRTWGHDYSLFASCSGDAGVCFGWGMGIKQADYLILQHSEQPGKTARYRVTKIRYFDDPPDMWRAELKFAPRPEVSHAHLNER